MIYWAQLFHFYQPPTQLPMVLDKICTESYTPLLEVLQQHPESRATVNVNSVTLEMLHDYGHDSVISDLKELGDKGQIEFTGSGKYHPILPLVPQAERKRQIELNLTVLRHFLGNDYTPKGFFPPEMAYSRDILPEIIAGYKWIIVSGVACPVSWPTQKVCRVEHNGETIAVLFRDDVLSNKISFKQITAGDFLEHLKQSQNGDKDIYVITAMDAETYGHHIQNWERLFLGAVYDSLHPTIETYAGIKQISPPATQESVLLASSEFASQVKTVTISQLLDIFPAGDTVDPKSTSWSTSGDDLASGNPYPLWADPHNEIHGLLWEHLRLCQETVDKAQECGNSEECEFYARISRGLLDIAEHSDQFWWASRRPMWDLNLVHLGLTQQWRALVNGYRAINKSETAAETKREYYHKLTAARDIRGKIEDRLFVL